MQLKKELTLLKKGSQKVQDHLHTIKSLEDEIYLIDHPISENDLTLYILNGLRAEFHEIVVLIRARKRRISFKELHDLFVRHDACLRHLKAASQPLVALANYINRQTSPSRSSKGNVSRNTNKNPFGQA